MLPVTAAALVLAAAANAVTAAEAASARIVVQNAPLAGFMYYDGAAVWDEMKKGDRLALVREPRNAYDPNAVRLEWNGRMLGYVPKRDNADLARQMDHGARVEARITELKRASNGRHRISYVVYIQLAPGER
jgi:hypothetical protein